MEENGAAEAVGMESWMERHECSPRKDAVARFVSGKGQWNAEEFVASSLFAIQKMFKRNLRPRS